MTIEFSQKDLDYLAEKIAERLKGESKPIATLNPFDKMTINDIIDEGHAIMSVRLYNILVQYFSGWTLKDLAGVMWREYKRVRGMGPRTYNELCLLFEKLNYKPGWNRLKYDHKKSSYIIIER